MSVSITLDDKTISICKDPTASNTAERYAKTAIVAVVPVKYQEKGVDDEGWTYPYNTITRIKILLRTPPRKPQRVIDIELQDVSNQPTWSDGSVEDQHQSIDDISEWLATAVPQVSVSPLTLSFGNVQTNSFSASQTITVSGTSLDANIVLTAPAGFIINLDNSNTNASPISLVPVSGTVAPTTVYVKFNPTLVQPYSGNISISSTGATSHDVFVDGAGVQAEITVSPTSLSFPNTYINETSANQTYTVSGTDLVSDIVVTPPTDFEISLSAGSGFTSSPINLTPVSGTVAATTIYVRFKPTSVQVYSVNITHTSTNAVTKNVGLSTQSLAAFIGLSTGSLSFPHTYVGLQSAQQSYTVEGRGLTANIIVTPPTGFQISTTNGSGYSSSAITLTQSGGVVAVTSIYVIFIPATDAVFSSNITHTSTGVTSQNLLVTGNSEYQTESNAYFAQLTGSLTNSWKMFVDIFVVSSKASGTWNNLIRFWIHASLNQQNARISLPNPTSTAIVEVNSPTWAASVGYTGNGSSYHLRTGYNQLAAGQSRNSFGVGLYCTLNQSINGIDIGATTTSGANGTTLAARNASGNISARCTSSPASGFSTTIASSLGYSSIMRSNALNFDIYKNGTLVSNSGSNSSADVAGELYILCNNNYEGLPNSFSSQRVAITVITNGSMNQANLYSEIQTLATNLGFNV